jgi:hypothetical protein
MSCVNHRTCRRSGALSLCTYEATLRRQHLGGNTRYSLFGWESDCRRRLKERTWHAAGPDAHTYPRFLSSASLSLALETSLDCGCEQRTSASAHLLQRQNSCFIQASRLCFDTRHLCHEEQLTFQYTRDKRISLFHHQVHHRCILRLYFLSNHRKKYIQNYHFCVDFNVSHT